MDSFCNEHCHGRTIEVPSTEAQTLQGHSQHSSAANVGHLRVGTEAGQAVRGKIKQGQLQIQPGYFEVLMKEVGLDREKVIAQNNARESAWQWLPLTVENAAYNPLESEDVQQYLKTIGQKDDSFVDVWRAERRLILEAIRLGQVTHPLLHPTGILHPTGNSTTDPSEEDEFFGSNSLTTRRAVTSNQDMLKDLRSRGIDIGVLKYSDDHAYVEAITRPYLHKSDGHALCPNRCKLLDDYLRLILHRSRTFVEALKRDRKRVSKQNRKRMRQISNATSVDHVDHHFSTTNEPAYFDEGLHLRGFNRGQSESSTRVTGPYFPSTRFDYHHAHGYTAPSMQTQNDSRIINHPTQDHDSLLTRTFQETSSYHGQAFHDPSTFQTYHEPQYSPHLQPLTYASIHHQPPDTELRLGMGMYPCGDVQTRENEPPKLPESIDSQGYPYAGRTSY